MTRDIVNSRIAVLETQIEDLRRQLDSRISAQEHAVTIALTAAERITQIAQTTADRAVARAEAAASKEYLESQIESLRQSTIDQIIAQKEAITAALTAAKEALTAALASSEKAIHKAEIAAESRFASVNEFRAQLSDQSRTFLVKTEATLHFNVLDKRLDELSSWRREIDVKFANYVTVGRHTQMIDELTVWRRGVDAALTAAQSRTGLMAAVFAMAIAAGGLLIAIFNLFTKSTV